MRKYEQNIEVVDPQLKNNVELVEILVEFENSWSQGLTYFLNSKKLNQLLHFSQVIEAIGEKHKQFADQLEQRDTEIFVIIPSLLILKSIENDDKEICSFFYPEIIDKNSEKGKIMLQLKVNKEIRGLAMCLSRFKPADWNKFLDVVIK